MGARLINNPKTVSGGDVHDYFSLKLHDLKARGFFVGGKATIRAASTGRLIVDLKSPGDPYVQFDVVTGSGIESHIIPLTSRPTQFGGKRWYFVDEAGRRCEKLYLVGGRFISRQAGGLTYHSQPWVI